VDGQTRTCAFEVLPDPRVRAGREELVAQLELLVRIRDHLSRANRAVNEVGTLLSQARAWEARTAGDPACTAVHRAATRLSEQRGAVRGGLIDVHMRESQLWASGLREKLNALFDSVDSADHAPPRQAYEVCGRLSAELDRLVARLVAIREREGKALAAAGRDAGLPIVGPPRGVSAAGRTSYRRGISAAERLGVGIAGGGRSGRPPRFAMVPRRPPHRDGVPAHPRRHPCRRDLPGQHAARG
jgi:hypothetical protein